MPPFRFPPSPTFSDSSTGCDDYDTKPIELQRLLGKIETLLAAAGQ
jgi:DNA-binding response OmpR family regulator